jgi:hypothetical protein
MIICLPGAHFAEYVALTAASFTFPSTFQSPSSCSNCLRASAGTFGAVFSDCPTTIDPANNNAVLNMIRAPVARREVATDDDAIVGKRATGINHGYASTIGILAGGGSGTSPIPPWP